MLETYPNSFVRKAMESTTQYANDVTPRTSFMRQEPEVVRAKLAAGDYLHDADWQAEATRWLAELDRISLPPVEPVRPTTADADSLISWIAVTLLILSIAVSAIALIFYGS